MPPKVIPTRQAATEKCCSVPSILAAIKRGAIDGQQMGREYVIFPNKKYREWEPDRLRQQIGMESQRGRTGKHR